MKVAISQPTYLPWMGYFDLLDQVEVFVALDNVQFAKRSWQQRNRIKTATGLQWLTVPVKSRGRYEQFIKDVEIQDSSFVRDHLRAIEHAYQRSAHFDQYFPDLRREFTQPHCPASLLELNLRLLNWLKQALGVRTKVVTASSLGESGRRTELLAKICAVLGATEYLSPLGSAAYLLEEQEILSSKGVQISFQNYDHPVYPQVFKPFDPFASVVDLIFNTGENALAILRSGRRPPYSLDQARALPVAAGAASPS